MSLKKQFQGSKKSARRERVKHERAKELRINEQNRMFDEVLNDPESSIEDMAKVLGVRLN